jgi:hypothetical protein
MRIREESGLHFSFIILTGLVYYSLARECEKLPVWMPASRGNIPPLTPCNIKEI